MRRFSFLLRISRLALILVSSACYMTAQIAPGSRVVVDAHNCYPYNSRWTDRIDRALAAGPPIAIEQDLDWYLDPHTGLDRSVLAHGRATGDDPGMEMYFFERVRPVVEAALRRGNQGDWPLITLNLDIKSEQPAHLQAIRNLLEKYQSWLTTAPRTTSINVPQQLLVKPILVLTGPSYRQKRFFYDDVPIGGRVLAFGAVTGDAPGPADNYHRWWNNPWTVIESRWIPGAWTAGKQARLEARVRYAHEHGLWIRFYSLDGTSTHEMRSNGWLGHYNLGSLERVEVRWAAAAKAGADYIATDQYETLGIFLRTISQSHAVAATCDTMKSPSSPKCTMPSYVTPSALRSAATAAR